MNQILKTSQILFLPSKINFKLICCNKFGQKTFNRLLNAHNYLKRILYNKNAYNYKSLKRRYFCLRESVSITAVDMGKLNLTFFFFLLVASAELVMSCNGVLRRQVRRASCAWGSSSLQYSGFRGACNNHINHNFLPFCQSRLALIIETNSISGLRFLIKK